MQTTMQLIIAAYAMEGIKKEDVAVLTVHGNVHKNYYCMAPQQHNAARAKQISDRMRQQLAALGVYYDVAVMETEVTGNDVTQRLYTIYLGIEHYV